MTSRFLSNVSFIIKTQKPCINCVHYIDYKYTYPEDELYNSKTRVGGCSIFGRQHFVTGVTEYDDALSCRINEKKCGKNGTFFIKTIKPIV
jgi:hypothetical protein